METRSDSAFIDLAAAVWKRKWMVLGITVVAIAAALAYGSAGGASRVSIVPSGTTWVKSIVMVPAPVAVAPPAPLAGAPASQSGPGWVEPLSGLQTRVRLAKTIADGSGLIDALNAGLDLRKHYGVSGDNPVAYREAFRSHYKTDIDASIDVVVLAFEDSDPEFAAKAMDAMVAYIDTRLAGLLEARLKAQVSRLDNLIPASGALKPVYQTERALAAQALASPSPLTLVLETETATIQAAVRASRRNLVAIAGVFSAIFFACFLAVGLEALDRARHDPETVARFKALSARRKNR